MTLLGIDTGGTFTDFVLWRDGELRIHKALSTPIAPERAILQGIADLGLDAAGLCVIHGSTVATNAVLEGKGARTLSLTNRGVKDLLAIGRQARPNLYDLQPPPRRPPVAPDLCLETGGRLGADGAWVEPQTAADHAALGLAVARLQPESVAVNLLFSYLDDTAERAITQALPPGRPPAPTRSATSGSAECLVRHPPRRAGWPGPADPDRRRAIASHSGAPSYRARSAPRQGR